MCSFVFERVGKVADVFSIDGAFTLSRLFFWPRLVEKASNAPVADKSARVDLRWALTASVFRYMPSR